MNAMLTWGWWNLFNNPTNIIIVPELVILQVPWTDPFSSPLFPIQEGTFTSLAFLMVVSLLSLMSGRTWSRRGRYSAQHCHLAEAACLREHGPLGMEILYSCPLTWLQKLSATAHLWMPHHPLFDAGNPVHTV